MAYILEKYICVSYIEVITFYVKSVCLMAKTQKIWMFLLFMPIAEDDCDLC